MLRRPSGLHITVVVFLASVLTPIGLSLAAPPGVTAVTGPPVPTASVDTTPEPDAATSVAERRPARADVSRSRSEDRERVSAAEVDLPVSAAARAAAAAAATPAPPAPDPSVAMPRAMATAGEVALVVPCEPEVTAVIGFHQASGGAVAMQPLGQLVDSAFPGWEPVGGGEGHDHTVMASRGRGTDPTTAVDVALPAGSVVTAPTSGVVELVSDYALYGRHPDVTIRIVPDGVTDAVVQVFHIEDPVVGEGDRVEAGITPLATVRQLPVKSQIDRITGDTRPHAHVEVRRV